MAKKETARIRERKAIIRAVKDQLEDEMVVNLNTSSLLVAPPEIDVELVVFNADDVEQAMPGRHWNHEMLKWTKQVCANVLNHIVNYGVLAHACLSQGVSYRTLELLQKDYPAFEALKKEAQGLYRDKVSRAIHNRAISGWLEPQFHKGQFCGYIRKFSDRLLELQAKRYEPEYRDKSAVDVNVKGGVLAITQRDIEDKEEWIAQMRKRRAIDSTIVGKSE